MSGESPSERDRTTVGWGIVGGLVVVAAGLVLDSPTVRMVAVLLVCLALPGWGWARRLRLRDLGDTLALTVVLSMSWTAVVATGMAVTGRWSVGGGLVVLLAIGALGLVPAEVVGAQVGVFLLGRPVLAGEGLAVGSLAAESAAAGVEWTEWYAGVRREQDEEQRRREEEAEAAAQEWADWMADLR